MDRKSQIRDAVEKYFQGLAKKDFELIPFSEDVSFRAPLTPGGVHQPLVGKEAVRSQWWEPLPSLLGSVTVNGIYFDDDLTGAMACAEIELLLDPPVRLRVADRLTVDERGRIVEQENHFDPREVTNRA